MKQRRNKALNLDTNSSMLCLKIRIDSIIISSMIFYLYREDNCQTFIKFYFNKLSVYKTGTIHNLMHNSIRFQSPDQEFFLAFRLVASSFIGARIALQDRCQVVLCLPDGQGLGPRTEVQIPCLLCGAFPRSSWFHFPLVSCGTAFSFIDFGTSE